MALAQGGTPVYEFKNGNWYNGNGFAEATWYSVGGKLTKKKPAKVDEVIDLAGRWLCRHSATRFAPVWLTTLPPKIN